MGRAYSKAAKLKARKKSLRNDLYQQWEEQALPVIQEPEEDPLKAPMRARSYRLGEEPDTANLNPALETEAGNALHIGVKDQEERKALFSTFMEYDKAVSLFSIRCLNRQRFPAVSKMEFLPERLEVSANSNDKDLRTEDQKVGDARDAMRLWDNRMNQLQPWRARIIRSVSYQQETLVRYGQLTNAGRSFVAAIKALHKLTESRN